MQDRRVVVTGLGAVTPVGLNEPSTWQAFIAGQSGVSQITLFDVVATGCETKVAAEVKDFDPLAHFDKKAVRRLDRVSQFALVAAQEALTDGGLLVDGQLSKQVDPDSVGVFLGTGVGGVKSLLDQEAVLQTSGARRVSPWLLPLFLADAVPGAVAMQFGLRGPNLAHLSACASGANAIGEAFEAIRRGAADVMVAGGSEAAIVPVLVAGFYNMGALTKWDGEPQLASRPFDRTRDGFVVGEGAAVLLLESLASARRRGAPIRAEVAGYGTTADAFHATAPDETGDGIVRAAQQALAQAGLPASEVDYVSAHGTSTPLNDAVETRAMKRLFGERAHQVPMSSVKSMIGHLLGAGGAVEAAVSVRVLETGILPPTINLHHPDAECNLDYVPNVARRIPEGVSVVLSNSLGFGGHNAALLFRSWHPDWREV